MIPLEEEKGRKNTREKDHHDFIKVIAYLNGEKKQWYGILLDLSNHSINGLALSNGKYERRSLDAFFYGIKG